MGTRFRTTFLRLLAAALVAAVSGVPQAVSAALADDCCAERCDAQRDCAPNCPSPSCLKVFPPAVTPARSDGAVAVAEPDARAACVAAPALPLVLCGVFHPPRA